MNSNFHRLFICPDWIAQAVMGRADPVEKLFDAAYLLERFSIHDLAFNEALQKHPAVERFFGDYVSAGAPCPTEETSIQHVRVWSISHADAFKKEIEERLCEEASIEEKQKGLYALFYATGITVLAIKPGFLKACENDNYLIAVFREIARHALHSESLGGLLTYSPLMKRFLQMSAILNPNLPPKPVFV